MNIDARDDIVRVSFYERAIAASGRYGFADIRDQAVASLQRRAMERDELKTISASVEIPKSEIDALVDELSQGATWTESILSLLRTGPLSGDETATAEMVGAERAGVMGIFPTSVISEGGVTIKTIPGGEAGNADAITQRHAQHIRMNSYFVADAIRSMTKNHGLPQANELQTFFDEGTTELVSEALARGVEHHLAERYDSAVHVM